MDKVEKELKEFMKTLQSQINNNTKEVIYFTGLRKEDIIKKVFRASGLSNTVHIHFWNGYECELTFGEFKDLVDNVTVPYLSYLNDLKNMNYFGESIAKEKEEETLIEVEDNRKDKEAN